LKLFWVLKYYPLQIGNQKKGLKIEKNF